MRNRASAKRAAVVASISALAMIVDATASSAQPASTGDGQYSPPPAGYDRGDVAPPQGQYAPPPEGSAPGSAYDDRAQQYDRDYAARYSAWAAQNCVDQRNNNTVAGAVIGGVLGAVAGSAIAGRGDHFAGAVVGGAVGATAGAAVGASSGRGAYCPPGYIVRAGAPGFVYGGPVYGPGVIYGPGWYNPWFWSGGQWIYRPYRYWYWGHRWFWGPGWRGGWRGRPYGFRRRW